MSKGRESQPEALADLLRRVVPGTALAAGLQRQQALDSWQDVVGEKIARHANAVALENGILLVRVDGSAWAQELSLLKTQIKEALDRRLGPGSVRDVRFHTGRAST